MTPHLEDLLPAAERLAAGGAISAAGQWFARGAAAAVAGLPLAARPAVIRDALARLVEDDQQTALHALAAVIRAERDAAIQETQPVAA